MSTTTNIVVLAAIASLAAAFPAAAQEAPPVPKEDHSGMDMSGDMQGMDMPSAPHENGDGRDAGRQGPCGRAKFRRLF